MSDAIRYIKASEILQAIEHAKKMNPKDTLGENAIQIDVPNKKKVGTVTYIPVNIRIFTGKDKSGDDKWEFVPLNIMFRKTNTRAKIKSYDERMQNDNKSVKAQFRVSSKSYWRNRSTGEEEEEAFGEAMDAIDMIVQRKIVRHLNINDKTKKINHPNQKINMFVQRGQRNEDQELIKKFEDPIVYVEIKFRPKEKGDPILPSALPWQCTIHDADKPRKNKRVDGEPPFEYASIDRGEDEPEPVNYGNIHSFITGGSSLTGFINANQISLSSFGISLSPRFSAIIVKKSAGFKPNFDVMDGQFDDLGDAPVETIGDDDDMSTHGGSGGGSGGAGGSGNDYADDVGDFDGSGDGLGDGFGDGSDDLNAGVDDDDLPPGDDDLGGDLDEDFDDL